MEEDLKTYTLIQNSKFKIYCIVRRMDEEIEVTQQMEYFQRNHESYFSLDTNRSQYNRGNTEHKKKTFWFCSLYNSQHRLDNREYLSRNLCAGDPVYSLHRTFYLGMDRMGTQKVGQT